jgi:hypothetical protein
MQAVCAHEASLMQVVMIVYPRLVWALPNLHRIDAVQR